MSFGKTHRSLWDGTLAASWEGWVVFVFLLAHADRSGVVDMHPRAIMDRSHLPPEVVERGLAVLQEPDPDSRSPDEGGRRIVLLDPATRAWGWRIVNYAKHRERTASDAERAAVYRATHPEQTEAEAARKRERRHAASRGVTRRSRRSQAEAEADESKDSRAAQPPRGVRRGEDLSQTSLDGVSGAGTSSGRRGVRRSAIAPLDTLPADEITADEAFGAIFWPEYPRKVGRLAAAGAWKRLRLRDDDERTLQAIMAGLRRDVAGEWRDRETDKIPHAATWLNQRRWEDG